MEKETRKVGTYEFEITNADCENNIGSLANLSLENRFLGFNVSLIQDNNADELELCKYTVFGQYVTSYILEHYNHDVFKHILDSYLEFTTSKEAKKSGCATSDYFDSENDGWKWGKLVSELESNIEMISNVLSTKEGSEFIGYLRKNGKIAMKEFELFGFEYIFKITPWYGPKKSGVNFIPSSMG